jgi:magnesium-protoporphyrin O-methyltransferase
MTDCCCSAARYFDAAIAQRDLKAYRTSGPDKRVRRLLDLLRAAGVNGKSMVDVGSGIGIVSFELLKNGLEHAVLADASAACLDAARTQARDAGAIDRVTFVPGDFVDTAAAVPTADVVVLDRVVCCYPNWQPLLSAAMSRSQALLALTYPKSRLDVRLWIGVENLIRRVQGNAFRAFVHSPAMMDAALRAAGWTRLTRSATVVWQIDLYARNR